MRKLLPRAPYTESEPSVPSSSPAPDCAISAFTGGRIWGDWPEAGSSWRTKPPTTMSGSSSVCPGAKVGLLRLPPPFAVRTCASSDCGFHRYTLYVLSLRSLQKSRNRPPGDQTGSRSVTPSFHDAVPTIEPSGLMRTACWPFASSRRAATMPALSPPLS